MKIWTALVFGFACWTVSINDVKADVNRGNLEVAKLCYDASNGLQTLGIWASEVTRLPNQSEENIKEIEADTRGALGFLMFVAEPRTRDFIVENRDWSRAMHSATSCSGNDCFENASQFLLQFSGQLANACRSDYLGN